MLKKFGLLLAAIPLLVTLIGRSPATSAASGPGPMPSHAEHALAFLAGEIASTDPAFYVVVFEQDPLALYDGSLRSLPATSPEITGALRLDDKTPASQAYLAYLDQEQNALISTMGNLLGREIETAFTFQHALNAVVAWLHPSEVAIVEAMPGVRFVEREFVQHLQTDQGPEWIGAPSIWDGSATPDNIGTMGEGVVIGVVDSGIASILQLLSTHPSFVDNPPADPINLDFENPYGEYLGACALPNPLVVCTDKLVGIYDMTTQPLNLITEDTGTGHGTHTSSTAAGNFVNVDGTLVHGVAPHANVINYKGCIALNCVSIHTYAGINQAVADGVDVINYSIGGSSFDPYNDDDFLEDSASIAFLGAYGANIIVAVAAGNSGPDAATVGSPSNAPWVSSVAATTHDRVSTDAADRIAGFSSRGPDATVPDVLKPDIAAPGVDIFAALSVISLSLGQPYGNMSGTSMASPHVAGSMALMRGLHPTWSPGEVRSALMLTAFFTTTSEDPSPHPMYKNEDDLTDLTLADPHDMGAGRVNLRAASRAGFTLDETVANFEASDPMDGGDPTTLNLASLSDASCAGRCLWERTIDSKVDSSVTWTTSVIADDGVSINVVPSSFTLGAGGSQSLCFLADVTGATNGEWAFSRIVFTPDDPDVPAASIPMAALVQADDGNTLECAATPTVVDLNQSESSPTTLVWLPILTVVVAAMTIVIVGRRRHRL